jgi:hypothetical protein
MPGNNRDICCAAPARIDEQIENGGIQLTQDVNGGQWPLHLTLSLTFNWFNQDKEGRVLVNRGEKQEQPYNRLNEAVSKKPTGASPRRLTSNLAPRRLAREFGKGVTSSMINS